MARICGFCVPRTLLVHCVFVWSYYWLFDWIQRWSVLELAQGHLASGALCHIMTSHTIPQTTELK
jgi:hypothetical protein